MTISRLATEEKVTLRHDAATQVQITRLSRPSVMVRGVVLAAVLSIVGAVAFTVSPPSGGVIGVSRVASVLTDDSVPQGVRDVTDVPPPPEVVDMAEQLKISTEQATDLFRDQGVLDDFVSVVASDPGFVAFRGPFAAGGALLIVEPGFETNEAFRNPPLGLVVRAAEVSAIQRMAGQREVEMAAESVASASIAGVAYDAFDNSYTVWIEPGRLTSALRADIDMAMASRLASNSNATVRVKEVAADLVDAS